MVQRYVDLVDLEKMLQNAYLDGKIGFDTAEKAPTKVRGFLIGVGGQKRSRRRCDSRTTSDARQGSTGRHRIVAGVVELTGRT